MGIKKVFRNIRILPIMCIIFFVESIFLFFNEAITIGEYGFSMQLILFSLTMIMFWLFCISYLINPDLKNIKYVAIIFVYTLINISMHLVFDLEIFDYELFRIEQGGLMLALYCGIIGRIFDLVFCILCLLYILNKFKKSNLIVLCGVLRIITYSMQCNYSYYNYSYEMINILFVLLLTFIFYDKSIDR